jgi:predicted DNA-binding protein
MENGMASGNSVRLTLELSDQANTALERVASHNGATKAEVLRRAIALIDYADRLKDRGESLAVTNSDRKVVADIVSPW